MSGVMGMEFPQMDRVKSKVAVPPDRRIPPIPPRAKRGQKENGQKENGQIEKGDPFDGAALPLRFTRVIDPKA